MVKHIWREFATIKKKLTFALVLALLEDEVEYDLYINATHSGLGEVLMCISLSFLV